MRVNKVYTITFTADARKSLAKIPKQYSSKIIAAIELLRTNPLLGKRLEGNLDKRFSIRIWPYRIVYQIEQEILTVVIVKVGHRQGVYK